MSAKKSTPWLLGGSCDARRSGIICRPAGSTCRSHLAKRRLPSVIKLKQYIDASRQRFIDELVDYLRFASVSAQSAHKKDMTDCARWLAGHTKSLGLKSRVHRTAGHPIVTATTPR